jgi:hypothetical protein
LPRPRGQLPLSAGVNSFVGCRTIVVDGRRKVQQAGAKTLTSLGAANGSSSMLEAVRCAGLGGTSTSGQRHAPHLTAIERASLVMALNLVRLGRRRLRGLGLGGFLKQASSQRGDYYRDERESYQLLHRRDYAH